MKWETWNGSVWYIINRDDSEYKKSVIKKVYILVGSLKVPLL